MTKTVRNKAKLIRTWFGGTCCVPNAWRRNESTITILVKDVTMMKNAGASESTVNSARI
jgi:hypothetical protein